MIKTLYPCLGLLALAATPMLVVAQQSAPLSATQLAECAQMVQTLRSESARLNQAAVANDARRDELAELRAASRNSAQLLIRYNQQASDFNAHMENFRREVARINTVKNNYDARCANRSYRRADLEALPPAQASAMRGGLADVRVPHTGGAGAPVEE